MMMRQKKFFSLSRARIFAGRLSCEKNFVVESFINSIGVIIFIFLVFVPNVSAQQITLSLSPPHLELVAKPGKSVLIAYDLQNLADPTIMTATVLPFIPKDNLGNIQILSQFQGPIRFSLDNSDLQLDKPFFMKSHDRTQLLLRIRVPEGAPNGDYYYTLLASSQPPTNASGGSASLARATIGSNILITVTESGSVEAKGKIVLFDLLGGYKIPLLENTKLFDSSSNIPVVLLVQNEGKNFIKPQGRITLKGSFAETATYDILGQNILAQSQRLIQATPSAELNCDNTKSETACLHPYSLLLSGFFLGKYNLSTAINFGEGVPNVFAATAFIALPFKFLAGILLAIIIAIIVIKRFRKTDED